MYLAGTVSSKKGTTGAATYMTFFTKDMLEIRDYSLLDKKFWMVSF